MSRRRAPECECGHRGFEHLRGKRHPERGEPCTLCEECTGWRFKPPPPEPPAPKQPKKPKCGKQRFPNRVEALIVLARVRARDNPKRPKLERRAYWCEPCAAFHLTARA